MKPWTRLRIITVLQVKFILSKMLDATAVKLNKVVLLISLPGVC